jgi:hypothetical protein
MPSLQAILVLSTLATSSLAAPANAPLVPRSFEVPRIRRADVPPKSGAAAMAQAFNKYGWDMVAAQKKFGLAPTSVSAAGTGQGRAAANGSGGAASNGGSVTASVANNGAEFLSPVTIGNQKFNMDFDTGSSDL